MTTAILLLLLVVVLIGLVFFDVRKKAAEEALSRAREAQGGLERQVTDLQARVQALSRYEGILDADARARTILATAEQRADAVVLQGRQEAERLAAEARAGLERAASSSQEMRARAEGEAQELRRRAEEAIAKAKVEAQAIIAGAQKRAEEIAGEAYAAMNNAKEYERTARAMKNVIEGYGDQYIVPTSNLLDELAEEVGYSEAGQKLKAARETIRQMVKDEKAAACDYVEDDRRSKAIDFVVDAFNGKVDMVLADVRHDNYGTMKRKIEDAFTVVNHNGRAFRNARITPEYLAARLEELRWAVVAQELKLKEREEQRVLKERIREEERAQREFERAMKEAEKEEEMLRRAMEKARREFDKAGDAQKSKYEEQIAQLGEKLREAEEKNQRAISMAQQTKAGHVYVISNLGSFGENVYKIGLTRRLEPMDRIRELGDASVPFDFDVHALIRAEDAPALERERHKRFVRQQVNKVNARKEFFRANIQEIRTEVERVGCQTAWTMAAAAADYKETQAIERAMQDKTLEEGAWVKRQLLEHEAALSQVGPNDAAEADSAVEPGPARKAAAARPVSPRPLEQSP